MQSRPSCEMLQLHIAAIALVSLLLWTNAADSTDAKFCLRRLADGFHRPVSLELFDDQAFVAEHRGGIQRVDLRTGIPSKGADISSRILTSTSWMDHRGLLSLRLIDQMGPIPDHPSKTLLVSSSRKSFEGADHDTVVTAIPVSEKGDLLIDNEYELTRVPQPSSRYNGGQLLSRTHERIRGSQSTRMDGLPEQIVYLTTGDGAMKNNESTRFNEASLTGKILRMILTNNGTSTGKKAISLSKPEIFALGFRNPWRCAIDTRTSTAAAGLEQLFCGDTAIDPHPMEEIFLVKKGGRYGHPDGGTPADEKPIYHYQLPTRSAVIGGLVYRGKALYGIRDSFIFGDYVSGDIFALTEPSSVGDEWHARELPLSWCPGDENEASKQNQHGRGRPDLNVVAFAEDHEGELLVLAEDKAKAGQLRGAIFSLEAHSASSYIRSPITLGQMFALCALYWAIAKF